ncbi:MAG: hypothetical protein JW847_05685 [Candidatus Omnitrophica bacterium]|nr:hypothetical protein [Candidatus Omnitrophota bacterium]
MIPLTYGFQDNPLPVFPNDIPRHPCPLSDRGGVACNRIVDHFADLLVYHTLMPDNDTDIPADGFDPVLIYFQIAIAVDFLPVLTSDEQNLPWVNIA